ncbi:MAG: polysaccharide pyruvyl transferase family protein [Candidatus Ancillula sp.]|nr:polysaccharide pyruvyl transferase family protein [Candidatus Ancillula sp.]
MNNTKITVAVIVIKVPDDPFLARSDKLLKDLIFTTNSSKNAVVVEQLFLYRQDLKKALKSIKSKYTIMFESCDSYESNVVIELLKKLDSTPKAVGIYAPTEFLFDDRNVRGDFIFKASSTVNSSIYSKKLGRSNLLMLTKQYRRLFSIPFMLSFRKKYPPKNLIKLPNSGPLVSWRLTNITDDKIIPISKTTTCPPELVSVQNAMLMRVGENFLDQHAVHSVTSGTNTNKTPGKVMLFETSPDDVMNFGDIMSRHLLRSFGIEPLYSQIDDCQMLAVGSLLDYFLRRRLANPELAYIWGSGFLHNDITTLDFNDAKICLVRGKLTLDRIVNIQHGVNIPLGDPGLIVDRLVPKPQKRFKLGIVPHMDQLQSPELNKLRECENTVIISPFGKPLEVIEAIGECEYVLSSSLHGIICADSYEIPNLRMRIDYGLMGGDYKFKDYYSVFDSDRMKTVEINETLNKDSDSIVSIIEKYYVEPKNLQSIKDNIVDSFPKDIF